MFLKPMIAQALLLTFLPGLPTRAQAAPLELQQHAVPLQNEFEFLQDKDSSLTLPDVRSASLASAWRHFPDGNSNFGWTTDTLWLRFQVRANKPSQWFLVFDFTRIAEAEGWLVDDSGVSGPIRSGLATPVSQWPVRHNQLSLPFAFGGAATIFLRVRNDSVMSLKASLVPAAQLERARDVAGFTAAGFVAFSLFPLLLAMALFFAFRERQYLWFVAHVILSALTALATRNLDAPFLYPHSALMAQAGKTLWGSLSLVVFIEFMRSFLRIGHMQRSWKNLLLWPAELAGILIATASLFFLEPWLDRVSAIGGSLIIPVLIAVCASCLRASASASVFCAGFGVYLVLMGLFVPSMTGMLPRLPGVEFFPLVAVATQTLFICFAVLLRLVELNGSLRLRNAELDTANRNLSQEMRLREEIATQLDAERRASMERERLRAVGELARNLAHELNTPLSVISLKVQALRLQAIGMVGDSHTLTGTCGAVLQVVERALAIVRSLRLMARTGEKDPLATVELGRLIEEVRLMCGDLAAEHQIELRVRVPSGPVRLHARETAVFQVLLNLVNNAIHALGTAPEGERWVEIAVAERGEEVEILVSDNGPGIADDLAGKLFEESVSTKAGSQGMGIGLLLARKFVTEHGGQLTLESARAPTCFACRMPRAPESHPNHGCEVRAPVARSLHNIRD